MFIIKLKSLVIVMKLSKHIYQVGALVRERNLLHIYVEMWISFPQVQDLRSVPSTTICSYFHLGKKN